ncbi:SusC/RagA family TonB-linked outer membrane protein [Haoranjiania flava]|uniref:TonB-dependent receptor n=1 Tax=Haoranjiania flava TaxID=1856322 RepID=A0AAE3IMU8_9BACT|nr:TonB-dependent receptor [Haoranjiania flava]MCU7693196.1 TonB-dependent receptor [Haoranjiania flava]
MKRKSNKTITLFKDARVYVVVVAMMSLCISTTTAYSQNDNVVMQESTLQSKKRITGKVTNSVGEPLVGASVRIQNTTTGTTTNNDGLYVIDAFPTDILTFSFTGYLSRDTAVATAKVLNIALEQDIQMLEQVVVVGYGKQKRAAMVSSISSVTSKELMVPTGNITGNLAGQLSGLIAIQRNAEPGRDAAEFWIRGISTFAGGSQPLVLVDGIPRKIGEIEADEVETFSLLKDAAATAVYGAEGANGVILVTTKRGIISKPRISFRSELSTAQPQRLPEFVDSWTYLEMANEARFNDGLDPYITQEQIEKYRSGEDKDLYPNTNWMKELLAKNVKNQRYTLNFRGGAENAKYFVSMAYFNQEGVFKKNEIGKYNSDFDYQRYNLRSNIDLKVSNTTQLNIDLAGQYISRLTANRSPDDIFKFMLFTPPHLFPAIYSDGTLATYKVPGDANNRNPFNMLYNQGYRKEFSTRIQSNVGINQDLKAITKGLSARANLSLDYEGNNATLRNYWPTLYNASGRDADGKLQFNEVVSGNAQLEDPVYTDNGRDAYRNIYMEGAINYSRAFERHNVGGMLLYMQKENQRGDNVLPFRKQGLVGRATYSFDNRYFIEGNFGYTGSETFAKGNRFGFFPAVGISYFVSNEHFYPDALKEVLNSAKIRLSIGRTGNDNTGGSRFLYRPTFSTGGFNFNQGIGTNGGTNGLGAGIFDQRFVNNFIGWEIENKRNIGIDLGFFRNQIELTADYFNNERTGILIQRRTIPGSAGFHADPWENYGIVHNHGVDASLKSNHKIGEFTIGTRGTFTFARNKVIEYDELPQNYPWMQITGTRVGDHNLYIAERLYTEDDFIRTQNPNGTYRYQLKPGLPVPTMTGNATMGPGDIKYADLNNDGIIDNNDRKRGIGHPENPEINYGFGLNVEYKGFYVSVFFQGTANTSFVMGTEGSGTEAYTFWPFSWGIEKGGYRTAFLNRWTADNASQDVLMTRLHDGYGNNISKEASTWWMRDASFLRFKNLEFGYTIPKSTVQRIGISGARAYIMGYNLYVWDNIKLWDPEMGDRNKGVSYPMSRTFTLGLEINL